MLQQDIRKTEKYEIQETLVHLFMWFLLNFLIRKKNYRTAIVKKDLESSKPEKKENPMGVWEGNKLFQ